MSAVVEVLLRKDNRLYINDGMYGVFWLLRIDVGGFSLLKFVSFGVEFTLVDVNVFY